LREHEPAEKNQADVGPVGDTVEDESNEGVHKVEQTEDHPVGKPVLVVVLVGALNRADRVQGGVEHSNEGNKDLPAL